MIKSTILVLFCFLLSCASAMKSQKSAIKSQQVSSLTKVRDLDTTHPTQTGRPRFVSAASGIALIENTLYVVADDELSVAQFEFDGQSPGTWSPLLNGKLPLENNTRKKLKPDWEALIYLPMARNSPALLAIPSGSKKNRTIGSLLQNQIAKPIDFSNLYSRLENEIPKLNIEGAAISANKLRLFHRGNGEGSYNAIIDLDMSETLNQLDSGKLKSNLVRNITSIELGEINGTRLCFSDAATDPRGHTWFIASAETKESTYYDGNFLGAVIGQLDADNKIMHLKKLNIENKPEGLSISADGKSLYITTDADDMMKPSSLYKGTLKGE